MLSRPPNTGSTLNLILNQKYITDKSVESDIRSRVRVTLDTLSPVILSDSHCHEPSTSKEGERERAKGRKQQR
jgi:hypothetical protein